VPNLDAHIKEGYKKRKEITPHTYILYFILKQLTLECAIMGWICGKRKQINRERRVSEIGEEKRMNRGGVRTVKIFGCEIHLPQI
jgi:hypothetical protein